jgi:hypothetical protein
VSSKETDQRDTRERARFADQSLAADRQGRDRLRRRADSQPKPSHGGPPRSSHVPNLPGGPTVTGDRDAVDRAAAEAVRLVAASYAAERALAGRRSRRQRDLQARAERLARHWTRQQQGARR